MSTVVMMQKSKDTYGNKLILSILILFALMLMIMYKIQAKQPVIPDHSFIVSSPAKTTIYLLKSKASALFYVKNGISTEEYTQKIKRFSTFLESMHYDVKSIDENKLDTLPPDALLFLVDAPALHQKSKTQIKTFVKKGGKLFFNFTSGFSDATGKYLGDTFVHQLTGLKLSKHTGFATFKENHGLFMTQKLLSPFSKYTKDGKLLNIILYDKIPFFIPTDNLQPDIYATAYPQSTPPIAKNWKNNLTHDESGIAWHGYYGKGKWVYTSIPAYSFYDMPEDEKDDFKKILAGMIDYLTHKIITQKYPYIDHDNLVFISEDTEYKFKNFERFSDLAKEFKIPVTAFIVADLAQKKEHKEMMQKIAKNPFVEFASHSTTHKKIVGESEPFVINETSHSKEILDKYASKPIHGFRPPREELNALMKKHLASGGFTYILGASEPFLYPKFDLQEPSLLYIPRHGTDDYSYLVNLDWSQREIVDEIIKETNFVTKLNGIYTLSVHTHLFSYGTNINILRKYYEYLQKNPNFNPVNGSEIYQKITLSNHLHQTSKVIGNQLIITITNDNDQDIKNLHIKLFKHPKSKITAGNVDIETVRVNVDNKRSEVLIDKIPAKSTFNIYLTLDHIEG